LEVGWHHADEDRLQLSLRAGRLDLYASRQLPSALEPLGADSSASAAAPPLAADSSTKNASPGQLLAELLAMPGGGRSSASRSDAAGPALALPFGLRLDAEVEIDTLQVMADVDEAAVVEPLGFFADTFTLEATGLGRGP